MDSLEKQVNRARRRLQANAWLGLLGRCLAGGAGLFVLAVATARVGGLDWPLPIAGGCLLGAAVLVSVVWARATTAEKHGAAVALDEAVGLQERVSSGLHCGDLDDPFARAVRADAERVVSGLSVRTHLPVRWPDSMTFGSGAIVLSLLVFWLLPTMDLFGRQQQARQRNEVSQQTEVQRAAVLKQVARLEEIKKQNPALAENAEFDSKMDLQAAELDTPLDLQREMVKKLENLMDSVEKQKEQQKYDSLEEMKKMLRRLQEPQAKSSLVSEVAEALSQGDSRKAREALSKLQDELAKHEQQGNREQIEALQKQLEVLGKKVEKLAGESKKLEDALRQAGVKPEDIKRMLENLSKKDFASARKQLKQSGLSQEQIEKLMKKLVNRRLAEAMAKNLGAALQMAAVQATAQESGSGAAVGMQAAADMLSEAEQLTQELAQLESTLSQLARMKDQAGCSACGGAGCEACQGGRGLGERPGPGLGTRLGQGRGGLAPEQETALGFTKQRTAVHTTRGSIIGSFLIKGSQFKGDSAAEFNEVFISAEKDLSEAIARDKIPPYARKTIKEYFRRGRRDVAGAGAAEEQAAESSPGPDDK